MEPAAEQGEGEGGGEGARGPGGWAWSGGARTRAPAVSGARRAGGGGGAVWVERPRSLSHASFSLAFAVLTWSHPEVATINSAHIASVLRRIASLQREEDAGAVLTTQNQRITALRMGHDPHHIASGVAHAGNIVRRAVGILGDVPQNDLGIRLELGRRRRVRDVSAIAMGDRQRQLFAALVPVRERRIRRFHPHSDRSREKLQPDIAHQRAREQPSLAQTLNAVANAEDRAAGARVR